eukprot:604472-Pelagomonas_calceolata.AAC.1
MLVQQALKENEGGTNNVRTGVAALTFRLKDLEAQLHVFKTLYMQVEVDTAGLRAILDCQAAEFRAELGAQGRLITGTSNQVQQHDRQFDLVHATALNTPTPQQLQQQMASIEGILQQLSQKRGPQRLPREPAAEAAPSSSRDKDLEIQRLQQELAASKVGKQRVPDLPKPPVFAGHHNDIVEDK